MTNAIRLVMLSGSFEYESEDSLTVLSDYLAEHAPAIESNLVIYKTEEDSPSLEILDDADVLLVFTRRLQLEGPELERIKRYCAEGRPIVGIRTASHAFQSWLEFDAQVLGGSYNGHFGSGPVCRVEPATDSAQHPVLREVLPFESQGSLYRNTPIADDATLLLSGQADNKKEPVAWTRNHQGGRVFYTSLGHQKDFWELDFLRLIENAIMWVAEGGSDR
jgi:type 1 glutamine amidotransferase